MYLKYYFKSSHSLNKKHWQIDLIGQKYSEVSSSEDGHNWWPNLRHIGSPIDKWTYLGRMLNYSLEMPSIFFNLHCSILFLDLIKSIRIKYVSVADFEQNQFKTVSILL